MRSSGGLRVVQYPAALADAPGAGACSGGTIAAGTYNGLTVTGDCTFVDGATITIDGNLTVVDGAVLNAHAASLFIHGYQGGWLGLIRNDVGGNLDFSNNVSVVAETGPGVDADANEVQTNTIAGNLICHGNTPNAQVNPDDGGQPNIVGGQKIGECAGL